MIQLYFIRHGKTPGNLRREYVGRTDESLSPEGITEIKLRVREGFYPPEPEIVFTSTMRRCKETAELIWPGCNIAANGMLRECDFGIFEGKTYEQLKDVPEYRRWIGGELEDIPGGESSRQFRERCATGFEGIATYLTQKGFSHAALVLHGGVIMAILEAYCQDEDLEGDSFYRWQIPTCGLIIANLTGSEGDFALTECQIVLPEK